MIKNQVTSPKKESSRDLSEITSQLMKAYSLDCGVNRRGVSSIPSKKEIEKLIQDLLVVLFPGYLGDLPIADSDAEEYVKKSLLSFRTRLKKVIEKSVNYGCKFTEKCTANIRKVSADEVVDDLLKKIPVIRTHLTGDIFAAFNGDPAAKSCEEIIGCYPSILAISIYRVAHELYVNKVPLVPRMMSEYAHSQTGIDINPGAKIGLNFFIDHGTGTVIGETSEIGDNVRIYQGVTIGALSVPAEEVSRMRGNGKRHPTIEDNVTIYSGATILGGKTVIGRGSVIGGNVWITSSIPPNTQVTLASPGLKIIERQEVK